MTDVPLPHRREFSRVPVHLQAEVTLDGGTRLDGTLENLSLKGGFLRTAAAPAGLGNHWVKRWWLHRDVHRLFGLKFWSFVVGAAPLDPDLEAVMEREILRDQIAQRTLDHVEAVTAFREKRQPTFNRQ